MVQSADTSGFLPHHSRAEFGHWATGVANTYGYTVAVSGIGDDEPELGSPSQLAIFTKITTGAIA